MRKFTNTADAIRHSLKHKEVAIAAVKDPEEALEEVEVIYSLECSVKWQANSNDDYEVSGTQDGQEWNILIEEAEMVEPTPWKIAFPKISTDLFNEFKKMHLGRSDFMQSVDEVNVAIGTSSQTNKTVIAVVEDPDKEMLRLLYDEPFTPLIWRKIPAECQHGPGWEVKAVEHGKKWYDIIIQQKP